MSGKEPSSKGVVKGFKLNRKIKAVTRGLGVIAMVLEVSLVKGKKRVKIEECFWIHHCTFSQLRALALKSGRSAFKILTFLFLSV